MSTRFCSTCRSHQPATFGWVRTCPKCKAKRTYVRRDSEPDPLLLESFLPMPLLGERKALVYPLGYGEAA